MDYQQLVKTIREHNYRYYDLNSPTISDQEYDDLYDQLVALEQRQGWKVYDSPSDHVGGTAGKVKHPYPLYSLNKTYNAEDVNPEFEIKSPKIDGANITALYREGYLFAILKRGDGEFGDNIIHLSEGIEDLPHCVETAIGNAAINGECVTDLDVTNFRNFVSGALGLKDLEEFKTRHIRFIAHDILNMEEDYLTKMEILAENGFLTVLSEEALDYPTDGWVFRVNSWKRAQQLGYTSKYPRFAIALKERGKNVAETILQRVEWVIGRTGTINPVGIVSPVVLDDATVTRVTLHNMAFILTHQLGLGDKIEIERAGGIIPKFVRVIEHRPNNQKITISTAEEAVGVPTKMEGPKLVCANTSDKNNFKGIMHFIKTMEIKGLGPAAVEKMGLNSIYEIYSPSIKWDLLGVNGAKIKAEIERSKLKPYVTVLAALGIPNVGLSTSKLITKAIPAFARLREDLPLISIPGIGPKTKESILSWLDVNEEDILTLPLKLVQDSLNEPETENRKKICITGKLDYSRAELQEILEGFGYHVVNTVTKDCYALIVDDVHSTSAKTEQARKYNIKIIDYWANKNSVLKGLV